ncbi:Fur family transcriptional regulator [Sulfobacillus thermosulfidooxidans]|uniref:Fur family transcriptional regulator n=1 Tax=Sulfobacillus thermosulfidooxidans TaxID=28034 RepID=UPI0006B5D963|nr:Fur family transcriptional regulator [Sulfobacillus thermosulfidooxidans]
MKEIITAESLLRERGLRVTPQRQGILQIFLNDPGYHWSADQIRDRLLGQMPGLARGTTYKVLNELVNAGICEELATQDGMALYGLRLKPHHHFFCAVCHQWSDIEITGINSLTIQGHSPAATIDQIDVVIRGVCIKCHAQNSQA